MSIDEFVTALLALKEAHGNVDVTAWQYAGGDDELCDAKPAFAPEYGRVVLAFECCDPPIQA